MVQFTIAYVTLGFGVLLVLAGVLAIVQRSSTGMLTPTQRTILLGGLGGMLAFVVALFAWLRD